MNSGTNVKTNLAFVAHNHFVISFFLFWAFKNMVQGDKSITCKAHTYAFWSMHKLHARKCSSAICQKMIRSNKGAFSLPFCLVPLHTSKYPNQMSDCYFSPEKCRMYINQLNAITQFYACFMFVIIKIFSVFFWNNRSERKFRSEKWSQRSDS